MRLSHYYIPKVIQKLVFSCVSIPISWIRASFDWAKSRKLTLGKFQFLNHFQYRDHAFESFFQNSKPLIVG